MNEDEETFESKLGDVTLGLGSISREREDVEDWERISDMFSREIILDSVKYSDVEDLDFELDPVFPSIMLKIDGEWKKMFFTREDDWKNCFKRLVYMWSTYKQNNE